jgi:hypothetical protein
MVPAKAVSVGDYQSSALIIGALVGISAVMALFVKPPKVDNDNKPTIKEPTIQVKK